MESRFYYFLLAFCLFFGEVQAQDSSSAQETGLIEPQIERKAFDEAMIDTDDFELGIYGGFLSIEDFGVNTVTGFRLAYHINPRFFTQLTYGTATAGRTSFEVLNGGAPLLDDDERELTYYSLDLAYALFPGEAFVSETLTYNNGLYLIGGIGSTEFAGDDRFTVNYGVLYQLLLHDNWSLGVGFRDYTFEMDLFGAKKTTDNLEFSLSTSWIF